MSCDCPLVEIVSLGEVRINLMVARIYTLEREKPLAVRRLLDLTITIFSCWNCRMHALAVFAVNRSAISRIPMKEGSLSLVCDYGAKSGGGYWTVSGSATLD